MAVAETSEYRARTGLIKLLEIKDSDIRIMTLIQCRDAVDKGIHNWRCFLGDDPSGVSFLWRGNAP